MGWAMGWERSQEVELTLAVVGFQEEVNLEWALQDLDARRSFKAQGPLRQRLVGHHLPRCLSCCTMNCMRSIVKNPLFTHSAWHRGAAPQYLKNE